jgi:hypothetical protein
MGCGSSKDGLGRVDDSVHVMLKHDKKKLKDKGVASPGYIARPEHPLITSGMNDNPNNRNGPVATEDDNVVIPANAY